MIILNMKENIFYVGFNFSDCISGYVLLIDWS